MGKEVKMDEKAEYLIALNQLDNVVLIDVTEVAYKAGYDYPVRFSETLYRRCVTIREGDSDITDEDRLWMFLHGLRQNPEPPPEVCQKRWPCTFEMTDHWYFGGKLRVVRTGIAESEKNLYFLLASD
ncbi:MAG: hypothetical protein SGJ20_13395 [Planctomycetota bacterium]|nr:hypothetical protein [Planctomycetota bacterium]